VSKSPCYKVSSHYRKKALARKRNLVNETFAVKKGLGTTGC
jgi:hypothetical protein